MTVFSVDFFFFLTPLLSHFHQAMPDSLASNLHSPFSNLISNMADAHETVPQIDAVQVEGLVALKIIKHCYEEGAGEVAQGVLLGLVVDKKLEITNCFPYPRVEDEGYDEVQYQIEMMRKLRDVNVDHLHVGWYQSTYLGSFLTKNFVESQYNYQRSIEESVVLVYDPLMTHQGVLSFKAYRLTSVLMELYKSGERIFTPEVLTKKGISYDNLFEEVPVIIKNSNLMTAMLCEMEEMSNIPSKDSFLSLATGSYLEKSVQLLMEGVDELHQDAQKLFKYQKTLAAQQQNIESYKAKRAADNNERQQRGEPPLPDEDISRLFPAVLPPPRLENILTNSQISTYCEQLNQFASQSFSKLYVAEAVQKRP